MLKLFGLRGSEGFARAVAGFLDVPVARHIERRFDDGETYVRSDENVRSCDVYVIDSLHSDGEMSAGEKLSTLLIFIGSLKDASAGRVTVVAPYLAYARQDRKTESRAPITTKYVATLLEAAGADRLLTMDVHNLASFQNAFRIPVDNLEARTLFVEYLTGLDRDGHRIDGDSLEIPSDLVVVSPDSGGMSRARRFREGLERRTNRFDQIDLAYFDKERSASGVSGSKIVGDVKGRPAIILDDMIASAGTIKAAAEAIERHGGTVWGACATHGLFIGQARENLARVERLVITDTIPPFRLGPREGLHVIPTAKFFALAIGRTHKEGGSISQLLQT